MKNKKQLKQIASERIIILFDQAGLKFHEDSSLSDRYVELARKIAMRYKVKIPREMKRRFCKSCFKYLVPGNNTRIRINQSKIVYTCLNCKKHMRFSIN